MAPKEKTTDREDGRWRPRWWVATTAITTFGLGVFGAVHEILGSGERPAILMFCAVLIGLAPVTIMFERLRG